MDTIIRQLNWRYATKEYDASKKIGVEDLTVLKESIRLAPSSYGLQPYKVIDVVSTNVREQLFHHSYAQKQVLDASHYLVFAVQNSIEPYHIDSYIELIAQKRSLMVDQLDGFSQMMKVTSAQLSPAQQLEWNAKQAYIGLGNLLTTAALLHIDATPMEGFDVEAYRQILQLSDYTPVLATALGYRSETDDTQFRPKVRKETTVFFETL